MVKCIEQCLRLSDFQSIEGMGIQTYGQTDRQMEWSAMPNVASYEGPHNTTERPETDQTELTCKISIVLSNLSIGSWSISVRHTNAHISLHRHIETEVICTQVHCLFWSRQCVLHPGSAVLTPDSCMPSDWFNYKIWIRSAEISS